MEDYSNSDGKNSRPLVTPEQRELMMHALGSSHGKIGWRNYFLAAHAGMGVWDALVTKGLVSAGQMMSANEQYFSVTDEGIKALGYSPDILDDPIEITADGTPLIRFKIEVDNWPEASCTVFALTRSKARMDVARCMVDAGWFHECIGDALKAIRVYKHKAVKP